MFVVSEQVPFLPGRIRCQRVLIFQQRLTQAQGPYWIVIIIYFLGGAVAIWLTRGHRVMQYLAVDLSKSAIKSRFIKKIHVSHSNGSNDRITYYHMGIMIDMTERIKVMSILFFLMPKYLCIKHLKLDGPFDIKMNSA